MDLEIKDVAELLNISEETVQRYLLEGTIPSYRLNQQYRFNRQEIEQWLMDQKLDRLEEDLPSDDAAASRTLHFALYRSIFRGEVLSDVPGTTKEEIIAHTMQTMGKRFDLDPSVLSELFLDRERLMSTGLGSGVAIPHTRDFLLSTHFDVVTIVYPITPIDYGSLDGEAVHTLFFLFASEDRHHLHLLSKIAHLFANEKARAFFRTKPPKERVLEYLKHWESTVKG